MADILIANASTPQAPEFGLITYVDSTTKELCTIDSLGNVRQLRPMTNANTGDVAANAADTYLTGSLITLPRQPHLGMQLRWRMVVNKDGSQTGTAQPVWTIRVGNNGSTADTAALQFTANAQTSSAADTGYCDICITFDAVTQFSTFSGYFLFTHQLATTGLGNAQCNILSGTSSGYDVTDNTKFKYGISCNPGANSNWTFNQIVAEVLNY